MLDLPTLTHEEQQQAAYYSVTLISESDRIGVDPSMVEQFVISLLF